MSKEKKELISVEIFKPKDIEKLKSELPKLKYTFIEIDDLSEPYLVFIRYSENELSGEILEPNNINPVDAYELNESISEKLKELGFNSQIQTSEDQINKEINEEAIKMFKKIAQKMLKKKKTRKTKKTKKINEDKDG